MSDYSRRLRLALDNADTTPTDLRDALSAVLDVCDNAENLVGWEAWVRSFNIRDVIARELGVEQ